MKIIELVYPNPPQVFIQRHIKALLDLGMDIRVVALNKADYSLNKATSIQKLDPEIDVIQAPIFTNMSVLEKAYAVRFLLLPHTRINAIPEKRVFAAFIERLKPDLIHFHTANLAAAFFEVPKQLGIPYTLSLRGSDVQVKPLVDPAYKNRLNQAIVHSAGIHVVSDALWSSTKDNLNNNFGISCAKTIYTTVPIEPLVEYPTDEINTFVSIGRFHWTKALINLLLAFRKLIDRGQNYRLILVGDGEDEEPLRYWIKMLALEPYVTLTGKLEYPEIATLLRHSMAFIQSSVAEGLSNSTAEAMALGCPVFATNVGGTSEVLQDGINGFLLDFSAPETWQEKMILVEDRALMVKIRQAAWDKANELFSAQYHAQSFLDFYHESYQRYKNS